MEENSYHIRIVNTENGGYKLFCEICRASYEPTLPISMTAFVALTELFLKEHRHQSGTKQMNQPETKPMNAADYQQLASRTLIDDPGQFTTQEIMIVWNAFGLSGEGGEVMRLIYTAIYERGQLDADIVAGLTDELGDVLWYISALCSKLDFDFSVLFSNAHSIHFNQISPCPVEHSEDMLLWVGGQFTIHIGETADMIKKTIFHRHGLDHTAARRLFEKLTHIVACVRLIASIAGVTMETIMAHNIAKLEKRYPQGFSHERSLNREPAKE